MSASPAWLLSLDERRRVAVGPYEMVHVLTEGTELHPVPGAPRGCRQVLLWQSRPLPVIDLTEWADGTPRQGTRPVAIVAFRRADGRVENGALLLGGIPRQVVVDDAQALTRSRVPAPWGALSHSAFSDGGTVVPILDLTRLFSRAWPPPGGHH
jgi:chemotaxis signal transduction protein